MSMQLATRDVLEGLAIPFGSPSKRDLQGEWFSKRTDLHLGWFPSDGRPVLYHHGLDERMSGGVVGRQTSHEIDEDGVWVEVQLEKRSKYLELLRRLLDKGALGFSSGALPSLVKTSKDSGEILSWPWVELSTTPTPASADARISASKYLADADSLGSYAVAMDARAQFERLNAMIRSDSAEQARKTVEEGRRLVGVADDAAVRSIADAAARQYAATGDMSAAIDGIFSAVRGGARKALPIDPDTGLPIVPGRG